MPHCRGRGAAVQRIQTRFGPCGKKDVLEEAKDWPPRQYFMDSGGTSEEYTLLHSKRGRALAYDNKEDPRINRSLARGLIWLVESGYGA
ncbi:hypothetical protein NDU88_002693 [Pleurodeles waltl]|uniref:Uncharacterized protein n=1 Tax=Pleurodeles waltl TaxID=8319 RepID=A0AAV7T4E0_PLEWA|nr:hypothetical protein NDU88_002693 [Pleurodeles waltl]